MYYMIKHNNDEYRQFITVCCGWCYQDELDDVQHMEHNIGAKEDNDCDKDS